MAHQRSIAELLVSELDLEGVSPALVAAFIQAVKDQAGTTGKQARKTLTFEEIWTHYEPWGKANLGAWPCVQAVHGPRHLLPFWGNRPWTECGYTVADAYIELRKSQRTATGNRQVANATINREMATVKALFNWCLRRPELGITHNPLARYPDLPETSDRKFALDEEQFVRILENARPLLRMMLLFALESGMRRDEFRCLQWSEVDIGVGVVRLPAERTKARRARDVPLSNLALQVLEKSRVPGSSWVFPSPNSAKPKPVPKSTFGQWFDEARTLAGVKGPKGQAVWVHTIRKTSVTEKLLSGMGLQQNMDMHGHTSKEVHDEYRIQTPEYQDQIRDALNKRRRGPKPADTPAERSAEVSSPSGDDKSPSPLLRFLGERPI